MAEQDPVKGAKVSKPRTAEKVAAVGEGPARVEDAPQAEDNENFDPPTERPAELTSEEKLEAASEVPKVDVPAPVVPPTFLVKAGGRAWWQGQQILLKTGDTFTSETYTERMVEAFRECGVTIEQTA